MCDFEKDGSHLITIKTCLFVEFVRKWICSGFSNTTIYVRIIGSDIIDNSVTSCLRIKSSGNLEILKVYFIFVPTCLTDLIS